MTHPNKAIKKDPKRETAGLLISGAVVGAAFGSVGGPPGAAVGALVGGAMGALAGAAPQVPPVVPPPPDSQLAEEEAQKLEDADTDADLRPTRQDLRTFRAEGVVIAEQPGSAGGGELPQASVEAVGDEEEEPITLRQPHAGLVDPPRPRTLGARIARRRGRTNTPSASRH